MRCAIEFLDQGKGINLFPMPQSGGLLHPFVTEGADMIVGPSNTSSFLSSTFYDNKSKDTVIDVKTFALRGFSRFHEMVRKKSVRFELLD